MENKNLFLGFIYRTAVNCLDRNSYYYICTWEYAPLNASCVHFERASSRRESRGVPIFQSGLSNAVEKVSERSQNLGNVHNTILCPFEMHIRSAGIMAPESIVQVLR